jgi:UDP-N-acetylglucosamine transferase subunit ALG13
VFVTIGASHYPFDRLMAWVESWLRTAAGGRARCLAQHGTSPPPAGAESHTYLGFEAVESALRVSDVVVCHGGPGTVVLAWQLGRRPIVVPRIKALGECVDDHQIAFARMMAERGDVVLAETEERLHSVLDDAVEGRVDLRLPPRNGGGDDAARRFGALVEDLLDRRPPALATARAGGSIDRATRTSGPGEAAMKPSAGWSPPKDREKAPLRVLFIGGCGRSGSTLLDRIIGQVPDHWSVGEIVHIWRRGVRDNQLCGCGQAFHDCPFWARVGDVAFGGWDRLDNAAMLRLQHRVDRHRYVPHMIAPWLSRSYRRDLARYTEYLARLYAAVHRVSGSRVIVDSTKHASSAFLLRHVPGVDLRIVHLARDPRGVAYSWTKEIAKPEVLDHTEYMPRYHPTRMAGRWVVYNLLFHLLRVMGTPTVFVRYESLVRRPRAEAKRVLSLTRSGETPASLDFIQEGAVELLPTHTVAGNPMRFKQGRLGLRMDEAWRREMPAGQRAIVASLALPLMWIYGYRVRGRP